MRKEIRILRNTMGSNPVQAWVFSGLISYFISITA